MYVHCHYTPQRGLFQILGMRRTNTDDFHFPIVGEGTIRTPDLLHINMQAAYHAYIQGYADSIKAETETIQGVKAETIDTVLYLYGIYTEMA